MSQKHKTLWFLNEKFQIRLIPIKLGRTPFGPDPFGQPPLDQFMYKKTYMVFCLFFIYNFTFSLMNTLVVYVNIDKGIHKGKSKVAWNEKRKNYMGFLIHKI